jgi:hypothetical protein
LHLIQSPFGCKLTGNYFKLPEAKAGNLSKFREKSQRNQYTKNSWQEPETKSQ